METFVACLKGALSSFCARGAAPGAFATLVLGNESCDLDSAVCSLVYSYFLNRGNHPEENLAIPVLNINKCDLRLKTEVVDCFRRCGISAGDVPCLDEVDFDQLEAAAGPDGVRLVLVDHHQTSTTSRLGKYRVVEVLDHRPYSEADALRLGQPPVWIVEPVGSCSTLIMQRIWDLDPDFKDEKALSMARSAILADTVNMSEDLKKATASDVAIVERVEAALGLTAASRHQEFSLVQRAKCDTSGLSVLECLRKDLKVIGSEAGRVKVAMSSLTASVETLISRANSSADIKEFLHAMGCSVLILMGIEVDLDSEEGTCRRDLLLSFPASSEALGNRILAFLTQDKAIDLVPKEVATTFEVETAALSTHAFQQRNLKMSRKQLLPSIQKMLD